MEAQLMKSLEDNIDYEKLYEAYYIVQAVENASSDIINKTIAKVIKDFGLCPDRFKRFIVRVSVEKYLDPEEEWPDKIDMESKAFLICRVYQLDQDLAECHAYIKGVQGRAL